MMSFLLALSLSSSLTKVGAAARWRRCWEWLCFRCWSSPRPGRSSACATGQAVPPSELQISSSG